MLGAPLKMVLTDLGVIKSENVGNIIKVDKVYEGDTITAKFFNGIEEGKRLINDVYTNYIPFYVDVTSVASSFRTNLNKPVTSFLIKKGNEIMLLQKEEAAKPNNPSVKPTDPTVTEDPDNVAVPYEPICEAIYLSGDERHRYYEIKARESENDPEISFLVRIPAKDSDQLKRSMSMQINKLNDFQKRRPDVNLYVFPVTCFEDTALCDLVLPAESKRELFEEFPTRLDKRIQYDCLEINTFTEKNDMYFRTDHHWNVYGFTEGYRLMANMFKENYPDIEVRTPEIYTYDNKITFLGSNALATGNYSIAKDVFHISDFKLPSHNLTIEKGVPYGGTEELEARYDRYESGNYNTEESYNHYLEFFRIANKIVYPENNTGRNLLLICDSYSTPLQEALASHFDTTIVRYVDTNSALRDVDYEDLIDQNNITDVMLFEMSDRVIYDYYGDSLNKIN